MEQIYLINYSHSDVYTEIEEINKQLRITNGTVKRVKSTRNSTKFLIVIGNKDE